MANARRPLLKEVDNRYEVLRVVWGTAHAGDDNLGAGMGAGSRAVDAQRDRASGAYWQISLYSGNRKTT